MSHSSAHNFTPKDDRAFEYWFEPLILRLGSALITVAVVAASVAVQLSSALTTALQLDSADMTVSWWQWLTCHLTHWSFGQFFWDVMAFGVLGSLCEQTGRFRMISLLLLSSIAVVLSVAIVHPELVSYRGLSGVDSALFAYLACYVAETGLRNRDRMWASAALSPGSFSSARLPLSSAPAIRCLSIPLRISSRYPSAMSPERYRVRSYGC